MAQLNPTLTVGTNSYINHPDAQSYFSGRLGTTAFDALDIYDQYRALITASQKITFHVLDEYKLGTIATIPVGLENAVCELALFLASDTANVDASNTSSNIKKVGAGSAQVEFFAPTKGTKFPELVTKFLLEGGYVESATSGGAGLGNHASGTTGSSSFDDCDVYNRNRGFSS